MNHSIEIKVVGNQDDILVNYKLKHSETNFYVL